MGGAYEKGHAYPSGISVGVCIAWLCFISCVHVHALFLNFEVLNYSTTYSSAFFLRRYVDRCGNDFTVASLVQLEKIKYFINCFINHLAVSFNEDVWKCQIRQMIIQNEIKKIK